MNNGGTIVGWFTDAQTFPNFDPYVFQGFLDRGGTFTTLAFPGSPDGGAAGINDEGEIVGGYTMPDGRSHGYVLDDGTYTTLDVPGAYSTSAVDIDDRGQIVGSYNDGSGEHGFINSDGTFSTLDLLGAKNTDPAGINNRGQIVGSLVDQNNNAFPFLDDNGRITVFQLPGTSFAVAGGINDEGQIVGTAIVDGDRYVGFIGSPESMPEPSSLAILSADLLLFAFAVAILRRRQALHTSSSL